jgi:type I restriction enzyme R subunit
LNPTPKRPRSAGWRPWATVRHGPDIAFGVDSGERSDPGYHDTILRNRLHRALTRLNPGLPTAAVFDAYRKLLWVEAPNLRARNRALHRMLVDGVNVEYTRSVGSVAGAQAQVIDFERPEHNDWLAVNQFTVVEGRIASPELFPEAEMLPHLICSRPMLIGGGKDEADQHGGA